jgi:hypothetical protein
VERDKLPKSERAKVDHGCQIYRRTHISRSCTSGGSTPGEAEGGVLKILKPKETKRFTTIDLRKTRVNRSSTSGETTLGGSECREFKTPKEEEMKSIIVVDLRKDTCQQIVDSG